VKIVLASSNKGKIKEIKKLLPEYEVIAYSEILGKYEIVEDGDSFQKNAMIKAKDVYEKLKEKNYHKCIVIADDSGLSVPALNNEPGIYSARYAGEDASDKQNNQRLIDNLKQKGLKETDAYYTACLAIAYKDQIYTTHGWLYGKVMDEQRGENGFGYDPLFVPNGYKQTVGELDENIKKKIGHRAKGLDLAMKIIKTLLKH
jgi:XTP/dITP diphosphohydrolase